MDQDKEILTLKDAEILIEAIGDPKDKDNNEVLKNLRSFVYKKKHEAKIEEKRGQLKKLQDLQEHFHKPIEKDWVKENNPTKKFLSFIEIEGYKEMEKELEWELTVIEGLGPGLGEKEPIPSSKGNSIISSHMFRDTDIKIFDNLKGKGGYWGQKSIKPSVYRSGVKDEPILYSPSINGKKTDRQQKIDEAKQKLYAISDKKIKPLVDPNE